MATLRRVRFAVTRSLPEWFKRPLRCAVYEPMFWFRYATAGGRVLPDFLVIGTKRGGSSSLWELVSSHPLVARSWRKEVGYFAREARRGLRWYRAHFPLRATQRLMSRIRGHHCITGESDPDYLFHPAAPRLVHDLLPHAKMIAMLRNPVDRALSDYHLEVRHGLETLPLEEAIDAEAERLKGEVEKVLENPTYFSPDFYDHSYLARGVYVDQINAWLSHFPREQMLILKSEDYFSSTGKVFHRVQDFLGLSRWNAPEYPHANKAEYPQAVEATRKRLHEYFEPHNRRLYEFLGEDWGWEA